MTAAPDQATFGVAWSPCIFGGQTGTLVLEPGVSIADIVRRLVNDPPDGMPRMPKRTWVHGEVAINGHPVPREIWHRVKPHGGSQETVVTVQCPLADGGGQSNTAAKTFTTLASVALVFATGGIASGGLVGLAGLTAAQVGAGTVGANIAAATLGLAGALAIQSLAPPPVQPRERTQREFKAGGISGNVARPGDPLQRSIGENLVYPDLACQPLGEIVGKKLVVEAVYLFEGPHRLNDIRLGGAKIAFIDGLSVETRDGIFTNTATANVQRYGYTEKKQESLQGFILDPTEQTATDWRILENQDTPAASSPQWSGLQSRSSPDEVWVHLAFLQGLYIDGGEIACVPLWVEFRELGASTWIGLPELVIANWTTGAQQFALRFHWVGSVPTSPPTPPKDSGFIGAHLDPSGGWTPDSYFDDGAGADYWNSSSGATKVRNIRLYEDKAIIYLDTGTFPKGTYEFRIKRGCSYQKSEFNFATQTHSIEGAVDLYAYETETGVHKCPVDQIETKQDCIIDTISSVKNEHPIPLAATYRDARISIVSTKGVQLDQLSVLAGGYVPDRVDGTWVGWGDYSNWTVTTKPAPQFRYLLQGPKTVDPLDDLNIDMASIDAWYTYGLTQGHECNTILGPGMSAWDALGMVAASGYARIAASNKWGVVYDRDRSADTWVQLFTPRQFKNFVVSNPLPERPHALIATFRNRDRNWEKDTVTVYDTGYNSSTATLYETLELVTEVTTAAVTLRLERMLDEARLRGRTVSFETWGDGARCDVGSLVGISHDVMIAQAGRARVKSVLYGDGTVYGLEVDDFLPTENVAKIAEDPEEGFDATFQTDGRYTPLSTEWPTGNWGIVKPMRAIIRLKDGSMLVKNIQVGGEDHRRIDFETPFADPGSILGADCIVATGVIENGVIERMIVKSKLPNSRNGYSIECVDEASAIYAA